MCQQSTYTLVCACKPSHAMQRPPRCDASMACAAAARNALVDCDFHRGLNSGGLFILRARMLQTTFLVSHFWLAGARLRGVRWFRSGGAGGRLRLVFLRYPNLVPLDERLRSFVARGSAGSSLVPPHPGLSGSMISPLDRSRRSSVQEWFYRLPILSQVPLRVREENSMDRRDEEGCNHDQAAALAP